MEFLKAILGDDLHAQLVEKVNAHNGNEANKDNQIKIGNLGGGGYIGKGKHDAEIEKLNALLSGKDTELQTANNLIAELKKGTKGNEEMQAKISGYEAQVTQLQQQLVETKVKAALKIALMGAKAGDIDYLTFKVNEKLAGEGKSLELDDAEHIKDWDGILSELKTQFPTQFKDASSIQIDANPLPEHNENRPGITKDDFSKMGYQSRLKLKQEQPEVYAELTGKNPN